MSQDAGGTDRLRLWLWLVAALIVATTLTGGTTRLTGSGLSITEWRPVTGVLPPLSETDWLAEFEKYQAIPQFLVVNPDMTLVGFKVIYWWEWTHRLLGRLTGVVFIVPFAVFLWRGALERALAWKLGAIFLLGGLQGAIGWWMVISGLAERTDVSQYRLAVHLTLASVILAAVISVAVGLREAKEQAAPLRTQLTAWLILTLVIVQIFLGALVAKTGAGMTFNTWPRIDGVFIPPLDALFVITPAWKNFFENVLTVQFDHRMVAYVLVLATLVHAYDMQRTGPFPAALRSTILFALMTGQAMLGVLTLLWVSPVSLALAHQAGAVAVLVAATVHMARLSQARAAAHAVQGQLSYGTRRQSNP